MSACNAGTGRARARARAARTGRATATDTKKKEQAASTIAAPAATEASWEMASPTTPLAIPSPAATAVIGPTRSHHSRAVAAGATTSATAWVVPTAGTETITA